MGCSPLLPPISVTLCSAFLERRQPFPLMELPVQFFGRSRLTPSATLAPEVPTSCLHLTPAIFRQGLFTTRARKAPATTQEAQLSLPSRRWPMERYTWEQ